MGRSKSITSQIHKAIGSITHWIFRGLVIWVADRLNIRISPWLERNLAYFSTGLFLVLIGFWHYLPWLPKLHFPSVDANTFFSLVATIAAAISAYYAWRSAEVARTTLEHYQKPTIIVGHQNGVYLVIRNIGPGTATSVTCRGDENLSVAAGDTPLPLLIPFQGPAGARENYGAEYLMGLRSFGLLNDASVGEVTVRSKDLQGDKEFISRFRVTKLGPHEYKIEPIKIG